MAGRETKTGDLAPVVVAHGNGTRTVWMQWGIARAEDGRKPLFLVRDDNPDADHEARCLIPATELPLRHRDGNGFLVKFDEGTDFFCFAGVWRPASQTWPPSYAAVTVRAYPDIQFIRPRHLAIVPKVCWPQWLSGMPAKNVLRPFPKGSLTVLPANALEVRQSSSYRVQ